MAGEALLLEACKTQNIKLMNAVFDRYDKVDILFNDGTAIFFIIQNNNVDMLELLISNYLKQYNISTIEDSDEARHALYQAIERVVNRTDSYKNSGSMQEVLSKYYSSLSEDDSDEKDSLEEAIADKLESFFIHNSVEENASFALGDHLPLDESV